MRVVNGAGRAVESNAGERFQTAVKRFYWILMFFGLFLDHFDDRCVGSNLSRVLSTVAARLLLLLFLEKVEK